MPVIPHIVVNAGGGGEGCVCLKRAWEQLNSNVKSTCECVCPIPVAWVHEAAFPLQLWALHPSSDQPPIGPIWFLYFKTTSDAFSSLSLFSYLLSASGFLLWLESCLSLVSDSASYEIQLWALPSLPVGGRFCRLFQMSELPGYLLSCCMSVKRSSWFIQWYLLF